MLRSRITQIARSLDEQIDPAIKDVAEGIAKDAKGRVPVSDTAGPHLRDKIYVLKLDDGHYAVVAGDNVNFYGHIVEHGGTNAPPHPFLMPAFEGRKGTVDDEIRAALKNLGAVGL